MKAIKYGDPDAIAQMNAPRQPPSHINFGSASLDEQMNDWLERWYCSLRMLRRVYRAEVFSPHRYLSSSAESA